MPFGKNVIINIYIFNLIVFLIKVGLMNLKFLKRIFLLNKKQAPLKKGVDQEEDFSIDVFQLENLVNNQVSFLFFNLSAHVPSEGGYASSLLRSSQSVEEETLKRKIEGIDKSKPIVLICETGGQSRKWSDFLRKEGFINAFFVKGGIVALNKTSG